MVAYLVDSTLSQRIWEDSEGSEEGQDTVVGRKLHIAYIPWTTRVR